MPGAYSHRVGVLSDHEHEADVGFQEENEEVNPESRRVMQLAMQTLRKGLLFSQC